VSAGRGQGRDHERRVDAGGGDARRPGDVAGHVVIRAGNVDVTSTEIVHEACRAHRSPGHGDRGRYLLPQREMPVPLGHVDAIAGAAATTTLAGSDVGEICARLGGLPVPLASVKVSVESAARSDRGRRERLGKTGRGQGRDPEPWR
jgi:hypothetical protein